MYYRLQSSCVAEMLIIFGVVFPGELPAAVHDGNGAAVWWTSPPLAAAALALLLLQGR